MTGSATQARSNFRRGDGHRLRLASSPPRPQISWRAFLGHAEQETGLGLFSGSEVRSRETPNCSVVSSFRINPSVFVNEHPLERHSSLDKLSLSRRSPKFNRLIHHSTYSAVFFHPSLAAIMTDFNNAAVKSEKSVKSDQAMPAEFGLPTATFVVVAGMVGAGVLTTSGYTVALVGSNQWMLLLWVLGGVTAICGALTLAELSAALPRTGGDYVYLYETYGPLAAFLSGWVSFLIGFAGPSAASAFAFAKYTLAPFQPSSAQAVLRERILASVAILLFAAIHVSGRRRTAHVQGWITILKLVGLVAFALSGLSIGWPNSANLVDLTPLDGKLAVTLMSSMVYIYYAYTGWNSASYLAGEVRDPQRRLPQAIMLGTAGVTILYLALNVVYALALSAADVNRLVHDPSNHEGLEAVAPIAQIAAARLFGVVWSTPLSIGFGLMLLSTLSAYVLIGPRVVFAMAQAGQFPALAARLTRRAGTPAVATATSGRRGPGSPVDGHAREHHRLCRRRPFDLFHAGDELDLCPPLAAPRFAPAVPNAGISGHAGGLPVLDRTPDAGDVPRSSQGILLCAVEHPCGSSVLLPVANGKRWGQR